jgi:hypothetical protein
MQKIKILFLAANPTDDVILRSGTAFRNISDDVDSSTMRDAFEVVSHWSVKPSDLQRLLLKHEPHIVHFSGHGTADGEMVFEDESGQSKPVDKTALTKLFTLHRNNVRLIFLNACFSKEQSEAIGKSIDYTIGINDQLSDQAVVVFGAAFYQALAHNTSVSTAFKSAQVQLQLEGIPDADRPQLFIRPGASRTKSFISLSVTEAKNKTEQVVSALVNLASGNTNTHDRDLIRRQLTEGSIVLEQVEGGPETEAEITSALSSQKRRGSVRLNVGERAYRRIRDQIYPPPKGLLPNLSGLMFVGRDDSLSHVKTLLLSDQKEDPRSNLTIVRGWPGIGKTTLVSVLAHDPELANAFPDGVLWTALNEKPELISKMAKWAKFLGADDFLGIPEVEEAAETFSRLVRDKRMLLIVDDIWDVAHAVPFLRAVADTKCALLGTTRLTSVANALAIAANARKKPYPLPELSEEHALVLLRYLAPEAVDEHFEECFQLVKDLECLPLALHVAGRLLREEADMGLDVRDLINGIREKAALLPAPAPADRAEGATLPTVSALLSRSTDHLDPVTYECFASLGVFAPKPATFDVEAMKAVWLTDDPKPIIRKLVGYGLLEAIGGGRFQMHALLVQHANTLFDEP